MACWTSEFYARDDAAMEARRQAGAADTQCQQLWAIEVREPNPPEGAEALHWIILSTWPITDAKSAR